jgi:hypothetical protein
MLSYQELAIFDKLREIVKYEDNDIKHCGLICELYANGYKDGPDFHYSSQAWDDIISSDPGILIIVDRWRRLEEN